MMIANPAAAYQQGQRFAQEAKEMKRQNALADFYREKGAGIASGDQSAINGLAQIDPMQAREIQQGNALFEMQKGNFAMAQNDQAMQQEKHGLAMQVDRAELEKIRQQTKSEIAAQSAQMDAAQREKEMRSIDGFMSGAAAAYQQGPEAYAQFVASQGEAIAASGFDPSTVTYEQFPQQAALLIGMREGLSEGMKVQGELNPKPSDEYGRYVQEETAAGRQPLSRIDYAQAKKGKGLSVTTPDGTQVQMGGSNVKFTEGQSKDNVYATRARGALKKFEPVANALSSRSEAIADNAPLGLGRELQTNDFQVAKQSGEEFLMAILRKDTGAAITSEEMELYGNAYLPQPGDGDAVLQAKSEARVRAINALESGMSADQMVVRDKALMRSAQESGTSGGDMSDEQLLEKYGG